MRGVASMSGTEGFGFKGMGLRGLTLNPKRKTLNPKPKTLNPKPRFWGQQLQGHWRLLLEPWVPLKSAMHRRAIQKVSGNMSGLLLGP